MPITATPHGANVSPPSSLRTELNVVAALVAVGICLVILALLANVPARPAATHARAHTHVHARGQPARTLAIG